MPNNNKLHIDAALVRRLVDMQFTQWADLPIKPVEFGGWDNRSFHLGDGMMVRLPSAAWYASQIEKEQFWLPKLSPHLPFPIPTPIAMGKPADRYPWNWSIYRWIEGRTALIERIADLNQFAISLAEFLKALQSCDTTDGPMAGPHNFYRGGPLTTYDSETRQAITALDNKIDTDTATAIWNEAIASTWNGPPVWVHGDVAVGNLLVDEKGYLTAVIDFGCLGVGDPACELAIAWTLFKGDNRSAFRTALSLDNDTWSRGRGWALWKALIVYAGLPGTNPLEIEKSKLVIDEILADYKR